MTDRTLVIYLAVLGTVQFVLVVGVLVLLVLGWSAQLFASSATLSGPIWCEVTTCT